MTGTNGMKELGKKSPRQGFLRKRGSAILKGLPNPFFAPAGRRKGPSLFSPSDMKDAEELDELNKKLAMALAVAQVRSTSGSQATDSAPVNKSEVEAAGDQSQPVVTVERIPDPQTFVKEREKGRNRLYLLLKLEHLERYYDVFDRNHVNYDQFLYLDEQQLIRYEVEDAVHRKVLLNLIQDLRRKHEATLAMPPKRKIERKIKLVDKSSGSADENLDDGNEPSVEVVPTLPVATPSRQVGARVALAPHYPRYVNGFARILGAAAFASVLLIACKRLA